MDLIRFFKVWFVWSLYVSNDCAKKFTQLKGYFNTAFLTQQLQLDQYRSKVKVILDYIWSFYPWLVIRIETFHSHYLILFIILLSTIF
ncbi:hypothetical protein OB69_16330 [Roseivirga seohaensis subsp. aquiponti]|uniref:Uncharacterized protein n=1 Tax=Roseivirga seohaensis subsp. aquiponti TaxID=1566026 RepID=A0A0L8AH00_9BACT|nr:hypothetical protein OB69_16330 [Roseivirga seohaensis subsp. aquiponti]